MKIKTINNNINFLKVILSLFVLATHLLPFKANGKIDSYMYFVIHGFARLTVPLFLIITGFYIRKKIDNFEYIFSKAKKLFFIFIVWQLIYLKIECDTYKLGQINLKTFYLDLFYGFGHLWYLSATVLGLFLIYLTNKFSNKIIISISLLIVSYFLQINNYLNFVDSKLLNEFYINIGSNRNFLFYAFPYLLLGTNYDYWKKYFKMNIYFGYSFFLTLQIIELALYYHYKTPAFNLFLNGIPFSLFIFNHIINLDKQVKFTFPETLSIGFYLIHFFVIYMFYTKLNIINSYSYFILYIFLVILTTIIWYFFDKLNNKVKIFF